MFSSLYTLLSGFIGSMITTLGLRTVVMGAFVVMVTTFVSGFRIIIDSVTGSLVTDTYNIMSNVLLLVPANAAICVSAVISAYVLALGYRYTYQMGNLIK